MIIIVIYSKYYYVERVSVSERGGGPSLFLFVLPEGDEVHPVLTKSAELV